MPDTVKTRLAELLRDCSDLGASPFSYRVAERGLQTDEMSDASICHNLSMAYGSVLHDLDRLGLAAFYRKDLESVLGSERASRIVAARRQPSRTTTQHNAIATTRQRARPLRGWPALLAAFAIVFSLALLKSAFWPYVPAPESLQTSDNAAQTDPYDQQSGY